MFLYILPFGGVVQTIAMIVMGVAVVQTVVTGVQYIVDSRKENA